MMNSLRQLLVLHRCHGRLLLSPQTRLLRTTVDETETEKFTLTPDQWWNINSGPVAALHSMNTVRIPVIKESILGSRDTEGSAPLKGYKILDIGCGGGILSEPLARLGAAVTGIDPNPAVIDVAVHHSKFDPTVHQLVNYKCCTVEELAEKEMDKFDCVVASEVIEHVADISSFIYNISLLVKVGGSVVISTINRTVPSLFLAKLLAEYVLNLLPQGTHDWNKFVTPQEVKDTLVKYNITPMMVYGTSYNPLNNMWYFTNNTSINYCLYAIKNN